MRNRISNENQYLWTLNKVKVYIKLPFNLSWSFKIFPWVSLNVIVPDPIWSFLFPTYRGGRVNASPNNCAVLSGNRIKFCKERQIYPNRRGRRPLSSISNVPMFPPLFSMYIAFKDWRATRLFIKYKSTYVSVVCLCLFVTGVCVCLGKLHCQL